MASHSARVCEGLFASDSHIKAAVLALGLSPRYLSTLPTYSSTIALLRPPPICWNLPFLLGMAVSPICIGLQSK